MRPSLGSSSPASNASNVDLPAPEAPTIATVSPASMFRSTAARMVSVPSGLLTCLVIFSALRTVCAMLMWGSGIESWVSSGTLKLATRAVSVCQRSLSSNLRGRREFGFTWALVSLLAGLIGLGLASPGLVQAAAAQAAPSGAILVLGDSLSAGYGVKVDATWVAL